MVDKHNVRSIDNSIFAGDWNNVLNMKLDKCGGLNICKKKYNESFNTFIEQLELLDIWRVRNKEEKRFTWRQKTPNIRCRLDYFLISQGMQDAISSTHILPTI